MKKQKRLITAMTLLFMVISLISKNAFAYVTTCKVIFDDGIHYMDDPNNVNEDIVVYCMNNELVWPHLSENGQQIPDYTHGYLKPEDIKNYDEMIKKIMEYQITT